MLQGEGVEERPVDEEQLSCVDVKVGAKARSRCPISESVGFSNIFNLATSGDMYGPNGLEVSNLHDVQGGGDL